MRRSIVALFVISVASACGGTAPAANPAPQPRAEIQPEPAPVVDFESPETEGTIARGQLDAVIEGGLGRFLSGIETEPALSDGRFVGHRLIRLYPDDERISGAGLEPGDIILRINGQPVERPEQALRVFNGLRVASELLIEYQRGEDRHELRFEIVD